MDNAGGGILFIILMCMYFIPGLVASGRSHPQSTAIWVLNIFLGWTLVGWVIALVWSFTSTPDTPTRYVPAPVYDPNRGAVAGGAAVPETANPAMAPLTPAAASDLIEGLIDLKAKGHITDDELAAKRAEILKRIG